MTTSPTVTETTEYGIHRPDGTVERIELIRNRRGPFEAVLAQFAGEAYVGVTLKDAEGTIAPATIARLDKKLADEHRAALEKVQALTHESEMPYIVEHHRMTVDRPWSPAATAEEARA